MATGGLTSEIRHDFAASTERLLRRRLVWFVSIWGGLGLVSMMGLVVLAIFQAFTGDQSAIFGRFAQLMQSAGIHQAGFVLASAIWTGAYGTVLLTIIRRRRVSRTAVVRITIGLIVVDGLFALIARSAGIPGYNLAYFWLVHLIACSMFPWTVYQSFVPMMIILPLSFLSSWLIEKHSLQGTIFRTVWIIMIMLPAVGISWYTAGQRFQKSSMRFMHKRYGMLNQEMAYARQIHESMFPEHRLDGALRMTYTYEPMREIGGDYLHANLQKSDNGDERMSIVLLDVTGHGIPAALTVNRLYGEIDIRFAEQPDIAPGELLERLNKYVHLTLAKHSIYATALCLRADTRTGTIEYASGGHPPSYIRGADGTLREMAPTTFMLGASAPDGFDAATATVEFAPGDSLIAYTDGAIEARDPDGSMLRIEGLEGVLAGMGLGGAAGQGGWADLLLRTVTTFRGGSPPEDDTLVVELFRPVG